MLLVLLLTPLLLFAPSVLQAEIRHVPDDYQTIQLAINASDDGDVVLIEPGRYVEHIILQDTLLITVASRYFDTGDESYIARTIIDGDSTGRVVRFLEGETNEAQLIGLTIQNGAYPWGGGIYVSRSSPFLSHLIIKHNNSSSNGAGIYATHDCHIVINNITIVGNQAGSMAAINCYDGSTAVISNSIAWGNDPPEMPDPLDATFCDIQGGRNGQGNMDEDPRFADPENDDYNIARNSPCIDEGDPNANGDPDGSRLDIGALAFTHVPEIAVLPMTLDFGGIHIGRNADSVVNVINSGSIPLEVQAPRILDEGSPFTIVEGGAAAHINPHDTLEVVVRFEPTEEGDFSDTLRIISNAPEDSVIVVHLTGSAESPVPVISISPLRLDFGDVVLMHRSQELVTVRNTGDAPLHIHSKQLNNNDRERFSLDGYGEMLVAADEQAEITVYFTPDGFGLFGADLVIESDDPESPTWTIPITANGIRPERHFTFDDNTGSNHSILILSATIDEEPLPFGSEIGAFTPGGLCCGGDVWLEGRLGIAAWGDNEMTEALDGFEVGDAMSLRFWDINLQQESNASIELVSGDRDYSENGVSVVRLSARNAHNSFYIPVIAGWSMVSAPIAPQELNIMNLWSPVVRRNHLIMMKDQTGNFYVIALGFSNMEPWNFHQGYQVKAADSDSLEVIGDPVSADEPISLIAGWSMVAYFPEAQVAAQVAFRNLGERLIIAKDAMGDFYIPAIGFSNMEPLTRGLGYQVRVSEATDFVWNVQQRQASKSSVAIQPQHFSPPQPTDCSMSILLKGGDDLVESEVGAYASDGRIVGACVLNGKSPWGIALWGDDPTTIVKDGAREGEAISFRVWKDGIEEPLGACWEGSAVYVADGLSQVQIATSPTIPDEVILNPATPNPFNSRTSLTFALPHAGTAQLAVYDLAGRQVALLANGYFQAGYHLLTFDAEDLPTGLYLAKLSAEGVARVTKLTLLR